MDIPDRPKTPQAPEPLHREPILPITLPFPFFPPFPSAPGLIPPMFPRFPLPLGRGAPGPHPAMPNLPLPPRFSNPPVKPEDFPLSKIKPVEREKALIPPPAELTSSILGEIEKPDKEKVDNKLTKMFKQNKELPFMKVPERVLPVGVAPPIMSAPVAPITLPTPTVPVAQMPPSKNLKAEKTEKNDMVNSIEGHISLDISIQIDISIYNIFLCRKISIKITPMHDNIFIYIHH